MILDKHPNGTIISFDEDSHTYYTDKIKDFTSATTYLGTFFPEFEKYKIAKACAKRDDVSVNEILIQWYQAGEDAIKLGNMVHKFCEEKLLNQDYSVLPITEKQQNVIRVADKCVDKLLSKFELVASEKIIFSEKYKLAGTIDVIMKHEDTIILLDWKTNKEITTENKYNKYGLKCLSHLDHTKYIHYQLQLNLYKWLLLNEGYYDCNIKMKLVHLTPDGYKFFNVNNYQSEISEVMQEKPY